MRTRNKLFDGYLRKRHSVSKLVVHLVFTVKYRRKIFTDDMLLQLKRAFCSASLRMECDVMEMDGQADHVHLLVAYPPKLSVSAMVNNLKAVSSRVLRSQNPTLKDISSNGLLWSRSYFACSTGGASIDIVKAYIEKQRIA